MSNLEAAYFLKLREAGNLCHIGINSYFTKSFFIILAA